MVLEAVFSRWQPFYEIKNRFKSLSIKSLNRNSPSQNRVFSEKRPFTREFGKEMPFGEGEEEECLARVIGRGVGC